MSWRFVKKGPNWDFFATTNDVNVQIRLHEGAFRIDDTLYSVGPGRWNRSTIEVTDDTLYIRGSEDHSCPSVDIMLGELSQNALLDYIHSLPTDPYATNSTHNFLFENDNNPNNERRRDPNVLREIVFDYEKEMQKIGRRGAAEVAVARGLPAGAGQLIGAFVGGKRKRRTRKARRLRHKRSTRGTRLRLKS